jgi:hypothetical protein
MSPRHVLVLSQVVALPVAWMGLHQEGPWAGSLNDPASQGVHHRRAESIVASTSSSIGY